jgi:hypothetical protein
MPSIAELTTDQTIAIWGVLVAAAIGCAPFVIRVYRLVARLVWRPNKLRARIGS